MMEKEHKQYKPIELRSEEAQEIMGEIPPWILRHGITTLLVIIVVLLIGSWFFKYPDTITADITVTSAEPPASIVARSTGKIDKIYVQNNEQVSKGMPLAVIQNPADSDDMLLLIQAMQRWKASGYSYEAILSIFFEKSLALGSIQSVYASFIGSLSDYQNYKKFNYHPQKIAMQQKQLTVRREYHNSILRQEPVMRERFQTSKSIFERDSILLSKSVISGNEYDISKSAFLQEKQSYIAFKASLKQSELQLMQAEENLLDLRRQAREQENKYRLSLQNAIETLDAQIKAWERDYLLVSPINGVVTRMGIWSSNQNVNAGETVFTVVPSLQDKPKGKALLPGIGAGKVQTGQRVNVRINNFPDKEFGYLIGEVASISAVPTVDGFYVVEIDFPDGMRTNYGKTLPVTRQMAGSADIITEDLRLLERMLLPVKKMIRNQQ